MLPRNTWTMITGPLRTTTAGDPDRGVPMVSRRARSLRGQTLLNAAEVQQEGPGRDTLGVNSCDSGTLRIAGSWSRNSGGGVVMPLDTAQSGALPDADVVAETFLT